MIVIIAKKTTKEKNVSLMLLVTKPILTKIKENSLICPEEFAVKKEVLFS